jgi:hypothetical protein
MFSGAVSGAGTWTVKAEKKQSKEPRGGGNETPIVLIVRGNVSGSD